jgi:CHAT domain-containing protein
MAPIFKDKNQPLIAQQYNLDDRYRSEVNYLPESKEEVNAIYRLLGGEIYLDELATETIFKTRAPKKALLHLATHGIVDNDNPDFSRLYFNTEKDSLNDGLLHAHEIVKMNLSADLVTLSACNTGTGKILNGEGISSLGRAFAYANCPNQLISLWPANDKSTTQLMSYYYYNLDQGLGKSSALTAAKRKYLSLAPEIFKHPYYWAGFVYYGQNNPLDTGNNIQYWMWGFAIFFMSLLIFTFTKKIHF